MLAPLIDAIVKLLIAISDSAILTEIFRFLVWLVEEIFLDGKHNFQPDPTK